MKKQELSTFEAGHGINPYQQAFVKEKSKLENKGSMNNTRNPQFEVSFKNLNSVHAKTTEQNLMKLDQMHQTTSKKQTNNSKFINPNDIKGKKLSFLNRFEGHEAKMTMQTTINNELMTNLVMKSNVEIVNDGLKTFKRDANQQGQAHSLESTNQVKNVKNHINSVILTGHSSSQQVLKEHTDSKQPQFIQLKNVFVSNNQVLPQKKQFIILNKKQNEEAKEARNKPDSRNNTVKDGQSFTTGAIGSSTHSKGKFEKTKNIYSQQYQNKNTPGDLNSYSDLGIKGMKSRITQTGLLQSRNSQLSNVSSASYHNEIVMGTYGTINIHSGLSQNRNSNQFGSKTSQKDISKENSYHNTKTSFGIIQSVTNQEIQQMEVRGNNLGGSLSMLSKSNYNKFVLTGMGTSSKVSNQRSYLIQQNGKHHSVILSKHKNNKPKDKGAVHNQSQQVIKKQNSENTQMSVQDTPKSVIERKKIPMTEGTIGRHEEQSHRTMKNIQQGRCDSLDTRKNMESNLKDDLSQLKVLHNRKSEQLISQNNARQEMNIFIKKDIKSKQMTSTNNSLQKLTKLQKGPSLQSENSLPQIFQQQSEGSVIRCKSNEKPVVQKNLIQGKLDVIGNISNTKLASEFQKTYIENNKSFDNIRDVQKSSSIINNISQRKQKKQMTQNDKSLDKDVLNKIVSNISLSHNRTESHQNQSFNRKLRVKDHNKKRMEQLIRVKDDAQNKHNGIQLVPLQGVHEKFGVPPGTANTQGNPSRHVYTNYQNQPESQLQYNFESQQCNSELYQNKINNRNVQNQQQYYYNLSENKNKTNNQKVTNFEESFDQNFNPQFEKLDALDPQEDIGDIHNIQSIPIARSQKSQGTYRQNYQKINHLINKYHHLDNYSMSEMYDLQSQNEINVLNSQFNEVQVTIAPMLSQNSDNGQVQIVKKNEKQADDHPFNGPKLHLFKKGQSKSSQMKQRNIKTCDKNQRVFDVNAQQNIVYSQQDANSNHGYYPQRQQLSEGGANYQKSLHNQQKVSKTKKGHINISEILKENRHNGVLANNIQNNIDRLYTDCKSQDSQGIISQSSFELGQGTPLMLKGNDVVLNPLLDYDKGSKTGAVENGIKTSIEREQPSNNFKQKVYNQKFSELIAFETRSQQCPSQMSTLQQNVNENGVNINLPQVNTQNNHINSFLQNEPHIQSPYIINPPNTSMQKIHHKDPSEISANNSVVMNHGENSSSTRPNTTNPLGNHIYIVNNNDETKPAQSKVKSQAIKNFQHPKVGKNSKHPQVFKQNSSASLTNNGINQTMNHVLQSNKKEVKINGVVKIQNSNSAQIFAQYVQNGSTTNLKQERNEQASKSEQKLEPKQTGDFPSPHQIKQFNEELKKEGQNETKQLYKDIQNEINNSQQNVSDVISCQTSTKQNNMFSILHQEEASSNDRFKSLNHNEHFQQSLHQDMLIRQNSENLCQQYFTPTRVVDQQPKNQVRIFKQRIGNGSVAQNITQIEKFNENLQNKKKTMQHYSNSNFEKIKQQEGSLKLKHTQTSEPVNGMQPLNPVILHKKLNEIQNSKDNIKFDKSNPQVSEVQVKAIPTKTKSKMQTIENQQVDKPKAQYEKEKVSSQGSNYQISNKNENKDGKDSMRETNPNNFNSVAQTPCFAETPYTTNQFKGYKINPDLVTVPSMHQTGFSRQSKEPSSTRQLQNTQE